MSQIHKSLDQIRNRITDAEAKFGRKPGSVSLIAVSKTHPAVSVEKAYQAGQRAFGESYIQEAVKKIESLSRYDDIVWHFIGPVQSNKTKAIARHFDWVHSIDRLKIAQRLSEQRPAILKPLNICLQLNLNAEVNKAGLTLDTPSIDTPNLDNIGEIASAVSQLPNITLRGLMTIPVKSDDFEIQRNNFRQLRLALDSLNKKFHWTLDTLSMGMSKDMEAAIAEGTTMVRIGSDIFGQRSTTRSDL